MDQHHLLLFAGYLVLLCSILAHLFKREKASVVLLLVSAFLIFLNAIQIYPFINLWDERFHALVAKNMMKHPFMPTLYEEKVVNMVYDDNWSRYHIWLHKQPLFMWQMALSFKLFGVNEFAARFPNVILCCLAVYASYRVGKLTGTAGKGFYTALLYLSCIYLHKLLSGVITADQNDTSFVSYVTLSFWAWLEYLHTGKKRWLMIAGIFSGSAILCKWLVGLLVYLVWSIYYILTYRLELSKYKPILLSFGVAVLVALPWQLFVLIRYPAEARASFEMNNKHFTEPVDGHAGPFSFHFGQLDLLFGSWVTYLIIPAMILFVIRTERKKLAIAFMGSVVLVYLFFSFAATKMNSFPFVVVLPVCLILAELPESLHILLEKKIKIASGWVMLVFLLPMVWLRLDVRSMFEKNAFSDIDDAWYRQVLAHNKELFTHLDVPENSVLFNDPFYIETTFYSGLPAYSFVPTEEQYRDMLSKGRTVVVLKLAGDTAHTPLYLRQDTAHVIFPAGEIMQ